MIDSTLFSKSVVMENNGEEISPNLLETEKLINRSTLYHLILSFAKSIHD